MERRTGWYDHPEYYEAIFASDSSREMDFLLRMNRTYGTGGGHFLEPACGAGRLLHEGARRGLSLTGYDLSEAMLSHARKRMVPALRRRVKLAVGAMESFAPARLLGSFDLAFNLVSTFRYLSSEPAALDHLRCVGKLLAPGGIYVLGFHLTDYRRTKPEHERWVGRVNQDHVVCNTREYPPERLKRRSRMRNRLRVRGPGKDWLIETDWFFRTWDEGQADALFAGARLQPLASYTFEYTDPVPKQTDRLDRVFILRRK